MTEFRPWARASIGLLFCFFFCASFSACSSSPAVKTGASTRAIATENAPMPHPTSFTYEDLKAVLHSPAAPKGVLGEFADRCDEDFTFTEKDARALVVQNPVKMHWCFYAKLSRLQDILQEGAQWSLRQQKVRDAFRFLTPVAHAFFEIRHDSHYVEWQRRYSEKAAEWVFFKKTNRSPASELRDE